MSFGQKAFIYDSGKVLINPAVKELQQDQLSTLQAMQAVLQAIADNTDGLELNIENIDLNTDGIEQALADIETSLQKDALTNSELRADPVDTLCLNQLIPVQFDEVELGYTAGDLTTVTYKKDTVTVATLTLGYTDGDLTSVVRS